MPVVEKKYCEIRDCMKPGDIIAFSGENLVSEGIKSVTEGQISHVGVILAVGLSIEGDPDHNCFNLVAEATAEGVRIISLSGLQRAYDGKIWWLPLSCEYRGKLESNFSKFCKFLISKNGTPYDYAQAIMEGIEELFGNGNRFVESVRILFRLLKGGNGLRFITALIEDAEVTDINDMSDFKDRLVRALVDNCRWKSITTEQDAKRYFCSELATHALKVGGVLPDTNNIDPERVTPSELCQFNIYEKCVQFKGDGDPEKIKCFNSKDPSQWQE